VAEAEVEAVAEAEAVKNPHFTKRIVLFSRDN
jgi:hypothetical protein